jgi:hypothetical protein
MRGGK